MRIFFPCSLLVLGRKILLNQSRKLNKSNQHDCVAVYTVPLGHPVHYSSYTLAPL